ncbi:putative peptide maturation dehydrogenase [Oleiagrimonas sp.]|jgi:putative peptide maturation dehydrogenase|uniref:putative peptide maturation dehydrogenase n=1 Tax=Oleiagrimonas sp. TaxID=2010330 RepID=UPI002601DEB1|nr:putative peptide maturation dehydrogenase [Oleiagrimonas sp.]MDA3912767.1 putative peptide maturation dehydrogenase [Oleiagrimonas sp.]
MRIRRRRICFVQIADQLLPDLGALFSGELKMRAQPQVELLCPISGERIRVYGHEMEFLSGLPSDTWTESGTSIQAGHIAAHQLQDMAQRHVILTDDEGDSISRRILEAEDTMQRIGWYDLTAMYHAMTRWSGMADDVATREHTPEAHRARLTDVAEMHGPPPAHFPRREDAISRHQLVRPAFDTPLAHILRARRTTRVFKREATLPQADLAHMLYGCFGAIATREFAPGATAVKRTSASGGGLTPIDPYPLIMRVEGLEPGIYHYDMGSHALELLKPMPEDAVRELVMGVTAGQNYFTDAQAVVVHVGRFDRHHWKYRSHAKAYKALLMDSAHLSQTFYLLATELGRGAFYTAAINDADLSDHLDLDPVGAAPFGINGLGVKASESNEEALHFNPEPYSPSLE